MYLTCLILYLFTGSTFAGFLKATTDNNNNYYSSDNKDPYFKILMITLLWPLTLAYYLGQYLQDHHKEPKQ